MYYLATPMFRADIKHSEKDEKKLKRNLGIAKALEENGIKVFLPQRDVNQKQPAREILRQELEAIKKCKGVVVVLSDTRGIYMEAGYAKAFGKKLIGLRVEETREFSPWGYEFFDHIVSSAEEAARVIKKG